MLSTSWGSFILTPSGAQLRTTELQEGVPREPAPEQKKSGGILTAEEDQRLPKFTLRGRGVARAFGHDSQVKVGHCKTGVEIDGGLAVLDGAGRIAGMFAAEGHEVMSACVELIDSEETAADFLGLIEPAIVREEDRSQEQCVGVLVGVRG